MKVVIQHTEAPLYWSAQGAWTPNSREAVQFLDKVRALDYAFCHDIDEGTPVMAKVRRARRKQRTSS